VLAAQHEMLKSYRKPTGKTMKNLTRSLAMIAALLIAQMAPAQDTTPTEPVAPAEGTAPEGTTAETPAVPATEPGLALGEEVTADGVGAPYTQEVFTDWELRCIRTAEGDDPCQLYQLLNDQDGNSVAEVTMFTLPGGQQAVAGATIITPLETLLTEEILIQVDSASPKRYPFSFCTAGGCVGRIGFTAEDVAALKAGNKATITIVPVAAPDQKVNLNLSLKGFTAGYEAVGKLDAEQAN
jgi:invasion protein IalB